ncbi:MAG: hypothetical protein ACO3BC_08175, partial [Ilumatobacteraceae bacterium]
MSDSSLSEGEAFPGVRVVLASARCALSTTSSAKLIERISPDAVKPFICCVCSPGSTSEATLKL